MPLPPQLVALLPPPVRERLSANGGRLCLSGAARGADAAWSRAAWDSGDAVVHWSFAGHRRAQCSGEIVALEQARLIEADRHLRRAARALGRRYPPRSAYTANLLRRDHFQAAFAGALYAVAMFAADGRIEGGTAWAIELFIDRFERADCPAFVFDQRRASWLAWRAAGWAPVPGPPAPEGIWAGIGTRAIEAGGLAAIERLLR